MHKQHLVFIVFRFGGCHSIPVPALRASIPEPALVIASVPELASVIASVPEPALVIASVPEPALRAPSSLLSRSSLGAPSVGSTRALAVAQQTWWPQPLARMPLALRDLMALSCCPRALRVDGLDGLLLPKKMLEHWSEAVLRAKIQKKEDQFEQWLREDTERFLARWRSWNR